MNGLANQVAVVTGAAGLIGTAIARRLAAEDARVVATSRQLAKIEAWAKGQPEEVRGRLVPAELDLADAGSIRRFFEVIGGQDLRPTVLVANASRREGVQAKLTELDHESFTRLFAVDVAGHFVCARTLVDGLSAGQGASIVFLSSIYAVAGVDPGLYPAGTPGTVHYAAAKSAMTGLVRSLASQWGPRGVRVNAVIAGGVRAAERQSEDFARAFGRKTMLGRMAAAEEIAAAVAFLASTEASYITGETLVADGGFTAW